MDSSSCLNPAFKKSFRGCCSSPVTQICVCMPDVWHLKPFLNLVILRWLPLSSFSHPTAKRCYKLNKDDHANEQPTVQYSKPRPAAPPKPQAPPPPTTAPAAADTRTQPTPAPRTQTASLRKPPAKKPGLKAPNCPPPLPPPTQTKVVSSLAQ